MSYLNPNAPEARRRRILIGGGALLATLILAALVYFQSNWIYAKPTPRIIYFASWPATRTRDDVLAERKRDEAVLAAKLAAARRYIASLPPERRQAAQGQYDTYLHAKAYERAN